MKLRLSPVLPFLLPVCAAFGLGPVCQGQASAYDFRPIDNLLSNAVQSLRLSGCSARIEKEGQMLFESYKGLVTSSSVLPIASASKMLSSVVLLSLIDEKKLALDAPISTYMTGLDKEHGAITVRQLLSHSSGLPSDHWSIYLRVLKLSESARAILKAPLKYPSGKTFEYGQCSWQVAGYLAELVTKKSWATLVKERVVTPLGLKNTDFLTFGPTKNPQIGQGARSTQQDLAKIVRMYAARGLFGTKRILSEAIVREAMKNQTKGLKFVPPPHTRARSYGLGFWRDQEDAQGNPIVVSHPGAFGTYPWIDFAHGTSAVFFVLNDLRRTQVVVDNIQLWIAKNFDPAGVLRYGRSTASCKGAIQLLANQSPQAGTNSFALLSSQAPPSSVGLLMLGSTPDPKGFSVLGATVYLRNPASSILIVTVSDSLGSGRTPLPLPSAFKNSHVYGQNLWLNTSKCGPIGRFSASQALDLHIR